MLKKFHGPDPATTIKTKNSVIQCKITSSIQGNRFLKKAAVANTNRNQNRKIRNRISSTSTSSQESTNESDNENPQTNQNTNENNTTKQTNKKRGRPRNDKDQIPIKNNAQIANNNEKSLKDRERDARAARRDLNRQQ